MIQSPDTLESRAFELICLGDRSPGQEGKEENKSKNKAQQLWCSLLPPIPPLMTQEETQQVTWQASSHGTWDFSRRAVPQSSPWKMEWRQNLSFQPLSSPISHWSRLTPGGAYTHSLLGCIIQRFRSSSRLQISCLQCYHSTLKMRGQPVEGGLPTKRERKQSWKSKKPPNVHALEPLD